MPATLTKQVQGMLVANAVLLFSLIRTLSPEQVASLKQAHEEEAEDALAHAMKTHAGSALIDGMRAQITANTSYLEKIR